MPATLCFLYFSLVLSWSSVEGWGLHSIRETSLFVYPRAIHRILNCQNSTTALGMESNDATFVSTPLVRRYSHQLAQEGQKDTMSLALLASTKHEEKVEELDKNRIQDWNGWLLNVDSSR